MADEQTISLSTLKEILETKSSEGLSKVVEVLKSLGKEAINATDLLKKTDKEIVELALTSELAKKGIGGITEALDKASQTADGLWQSSAKGMSGFLKDLDVVSGSLFMTNFSKNIIPDTISGMGELGKSIQDVGFNSDKAFKDLGGGVINMLPKSLKPFAEELRLVTGEVTAGQSAYVGLEKEIISIAAAQGNFSTILSESSGNFENLNQKYIGFVNIAETTAQATGQTVGSVMNLMKTVAGIPGVLTDSVQVGERSISQLTVASQLATAYAIPQTEVTGKLADMYNQLGISGDKAFNSLANIYEKGGDSRLRFADFTKSVMDISREFKMLGDNTDAATNLVKSFDDAFTKSKLSPEAMKEVISHMAQGIEKMDLAKLSFMSSQTGGPGGIAGGIQMEEAIATGHLDEVLKKTLDAMKSQFGGEIVTRKEAAASPELAGEYLKQVQYLTDVAGIAGNRQEAAQILEAMKTGVMDSLKIGEKQDTSGALLEATSRGHQFQVESTNAVVMQTHQGAEIAKLLRNEVNANLVSAVNRVANIEGMMDRYSKISTSTGKTTSLKEEEQDLMAKGGFAGETVRVAIKAKNAIQAEFNKSKNEENTTSVIPQINGRRPNLSNPSTPGMVLTNATRQVVTESAKNPPQQIDVSFKPVEIDLNFMGEKIKAFANAQIDKNEKDKSARMGVGSSK